jgi:deoxyuridine 5'-triphosphate nucleotidohydrolase
MGNIIKYTKVREVKSPTRATTVAAGIDFYVPEDFEPLRLYPRHDVLIPSGIKMRVPMGHMLYITNKSGVASSNEAKERAGLKLSEILEGVLIKGADTIDEDYQGEIHLHLINLGQGSMEIKPGMKIAQGVLIPVNYATPVEVLSAQELFRDTPSTRKDNGFGSTSNT